METTATKQVDGIDTSGDSSRVRTSSVSSGVKVAFLEQLTAYTDGVGWVQTLHCLEQRGVFKLLAAKPETMSCGDLATASGANMGYLNVVLRVLAAQGWLQRTVACTAQHTRVALTRRGRELLELWPHSSGPQQLVAFLPAAIEMKAYLDGEYKPGLGVPSLQSLVEQSAGGWGLSDTGEVACTLRKALDGNLLGPVAIACAHELKGLSLDTPEQLARHLHFSRDSDRLDATSVARASARQLLLAFGWLQPRSGSNCLTELGRHWAKRVWAFGVPVSYLPLFSRIDDLLFGDVASVWQRALGSAEVLVDRTMNVTASGASHAHYFRAADEVILRAFNRPFGEQPRGFCDMGCGDGSWLRHVWELISRRTERGLLMRLHPGDPTYVPLMVGADYNLAARRATEQHLSRAHIPHLVMPGNINDPEQLRHELLQRKIDSRDLLHANSFLIHNRPFLHAQHEAPATGDVPAKGAYCWRGRAVPNAELEQNLVELFQAWRAILGSHGMLVVELHDPEKIVPGRTLTNYMLTHGLSDQFTVPVATFLRAAKTAQLRTDAGVLRLFPRPVESATISVNHLTVS